MLVREKFWCGVFCVVNRHFWKNLEARTSFSLLHSCLSGGSVSSKRFLQELDFSRSLFDEVIGLTPKFLNVKSSDWDLLICG